MLTLYIHAVTFLSLFLYTTPAITIYTRHSHWTYRVAYLLRPYLKLLCCVVFSFLYLVALAKIDLLQLRWREVPTLTERVGSCGSSTGRLTLQVYYYSLGTGRRWSARVAGFRRVTNTRGATRQPAEAPEYDAYAGCALTSCSQ
jgi:hypothetical protein